MTLKRLLPLLLMLLASAPTALAQQDAKQQLHDQLWEAARVGDVAAARAALDRGAEVDAKFRYGQTALFKAAERGHTEVVKLLLERGAAVNLRDTFYGATPISWALQKGHVGVVRALLEKGAEEVGDVLMAGAREGNAELLTAALDTKRAQPDTMTAALVAATASGKHPEIVELLKKAGAKPPFEVDAATLQTYAGKYKNEAGTMEVVVTYKDGKLVAQAAGQQPLNMMALDKTSFRAVEFDGINVTFNSEGDKVPSFTLKQGPNPTLFKRVEEPKQP
ncbi:MAG TPA: ankyrin repeat domain-containing protein [Pyrinomonadaceae bacterium]|nr:ankyrin repeat domain-containing protein [Pyrinomonadaceae bacterium]